MSQSPLPVITALALDTRELKVWFVDYAGVGVRAPELRENTDEALPGQCWPRAHQLQSWLPPDWCICNALVLRPRSGYVNVKSSIFWVKFSVV